MKEIKKVKVNEWMEWDMMGWKYHVVYAESSTNWELIYSTDDKDTAEKVLAEYTAELEEEEDKPAGKYYITDTFGKRI